jgi:hypothetical protein
MTRTLHRGGSGEAEGSSYQRIDPGSMSGGGTAQPGQRVQQPHPWAASARATEMAMQAPQVAMSRSGNGGLI